MSLSVSLPLPLCPSTLDFPSSLTIGSSTSTYLSHLPPRVLDGLTAFSFFPSHSSSSLPSRPIPPHLLPRPAPSKVPSLSAALSLESGVFFLIPCLRVFPSAVGFPRWNVPLPRLIAQTATTTTNTHPTQSSCFPAAVHVRPSSNRPPRPVWIRLAPLKGPSSSSSLTPFRFSGAAAFFLRFVLPPTARLWKLFSIP